MGGGPPLRLAAAMLDVCMYLIGLFTLFPRMYVCISSENMYVLPDVMVHTYDPDQNPAQTHRFASLMLTSQKKTHTLITA